MGEGTSGIPRGGRAPRTVFVHSREIEDLHYPPDCPFRTERAGRTRAILESLGLLVGEGRRQVAMVPAGDDDLLRFHLPDYLAALERASCHGITPADVFFGLGTPDTPVFADLLPYARLAAGGTLTAARLISEGAADRAFNPSGGYHHARPARAAGFCYLNDVVLACRFLAAQGKRVFCLDLDAHHGDGTQEAFYEESAVFTVSFHESGRTLFPGGGFEQETGSGEGGGYNVNVPLPAGTDDQIFLDAFEAVVPPLLEAYAPDVIFVQIGMDTLSVDPLAHLRLTNNAVGEVLPPLLERGVPLLAVGGGGYEPSSTARAWALAWSILCDAEPGQDPSIGLGGVFLGNAEWGAGLRDMRVYAGGAERSKIAGEVSRTLAWIRKHVFPLHGLAG